MSLRTKGEFYTMQRKGLGIYLLHRAWCLSHSRFPPLLYAAKCVIPPRRKQWQSVLRKCFAIFPFGVHGFGIGVYASNDTASSFSHAHSIDSTLRFSTKKQTEIYLLKHTIITHSSIISSFMHVCLPNPLL